MPSDPKSTNSSIFRQVRVSFEPGATSISRKLQVSSNTSSSIDTFQSTPLHPSVSSSSQGETNWVRHVYEEITSAIVQMTKLPSDSDFHLNNATGQRAIEILGFIRENLNLEMPKIINQDGEALSFTWQSGTVKRYLNVALEEVDMMELDLQTRLRKESTICGTGDVDLARLIEALNAQTRANTVG